MSLVPSRRTRSYSGLPFPTLVETLTFTRTAPFASTVLATCNEQYCAHCQLPLNLHAKQSNFTVEYFQFTVRFSSSLLTLISPQSCRNEFDRGRDTSVLFLEDEFLSRLHGVYRGEKRQPAPEQLDAPLDPQDLSWFRLLCSALERLQQPDLLVDPKFTRKRTGEGCVAWPEMQRDVAFPSLAQFEALSDELPVETSPLVRAMLARVARAVARIIPKHSGHSLLAAMREPDVLRLLQRLYAHHWGIYRLNEVDELVQCGLGVYPVASSLRLNEANNCDHWFDANVCLTIRAMRRLTPGEELTLSPTPVPLEEMQEFEAPRLVPKTIRETLLND